MPCQRSLSCPIHVNRSLRSLVTRIHFIIPFLLQSIVLLDNNAKILALNPPNNQNRRFPHNWMNHGWQDDETIPVVSVTMNQLDNDDDDEEDEDDGTLVALRGGTLSTSSLLASSTTQKQKLKRVVQGSRSTLASTIEYWSDSLQSLSSTITRPFRNLWATATSKASSLFQSPSDRRQKQLIQQLQTTPIERVVIVPNTTIVPPNVLHIAAQRAGLLGKPLTSQAVQQVANSLQQWYQRHGYVLASMTGATLQVDTQTAALTVQEPKCTSPNPVSILFCKEMVIDEDPEGDKLNNHNETSTPSLLTFRQYREKLQKKRRATSSPRYSKALPLDRLTLNTTLVPITPSSSSSSLVGRIHAGRVASALGLSPGQPFCWNPQSWNLFVKRGLFVPHTLSATPQRQPDGTVQLQLVGQEAPARHLEYGISKSLYTDSWEGEVDFHHQNVLGGGELLGIVVRRGTKDAEPSIRVRFRDDKLGLASGGYDVEVFSDFIGEQLEDEQTGGGNSGGADMLAEVEMSKSNNGGGGARDFDHDELLDRKGISMSIHRPMSSWAIENSGSATLERTSTKGGRHESVGSATLNLGPVAKSLPLNARTNVFGKLTTGTRIGESSDGTSLLTSASTSWSMLPFASISATTRQVFPLSETASGPLVLALSHSATVSSRHLPRHEANANGVSCKIRGYQGINHSERVSNSIVGTTELRIPVELPRGLQGASVVLFGDWCIASVGSYQKFKRRSSVGVSLRKTFQGLPIKYDISLTQERKIGAFFGLGPDFQV